MRLTDKQKKKMNTAMWCLLVVLLLLPLLVVATYTWFSISGAPRVNEMGLSVDCGTGLELAFTPDSDEWTQHLNFEDYVEDEGVLRPVTWSEKEQCFFAAEIGDDGRIIGINRPIKDIAGTGPSVSNGYYLKYTFYARTDENVEVSLTPAAVGNDGVWGAGTYVMGTPLWNAREVSHDNGGKGAEYAVRVGFRVVKYDANTKVQKNEEPFFIYEPNSDGHVRAENGVIETASIDGTESLVPIERILRQTSSTWRESNPVQNGVLVHDLGEFIDEPALFRLMSHEFAKIDVYVWLEGQDIDCSNEIGDEARLSVNIQFHADADNSSGLEEIK